MLMARIHDLDSQWNAQGRASVEMINARYERACPLCTNDVKRVDWESSEVESRIDYLVARGQMEIDLSSFMESVKQAEETSPIEYSVGSEKFYTVTKEWKQAAAQRAFRLNVWMGTAGGNWAIYLAPVAVRQQARAEQYRAEIRAEVIGLLQPGNGQVLADSFPVPSFSPGAVQDPQGLPYQKRRPHTRRPTVTNAWDSAQVGQPPNTRVCSTCSSVVRGNPHLREPRNTLGGWDLDHIVKWLEIRRSLDARRASPIEYRDAYNDLFNTRLRCVNCNRSDN